MRQAKASQRLHALLLSLGIWVSRNKHRGLRIRLMVKILHDLKDPKLWELWYIPYNGSCRILSINRRTRSVVFLCQGTLRGSDKILLN